MNPVAIIQVRNNNEMNLTEPLAFENQRQLEQWLALHHSSKRELWVRIYKKGSGVASVTWENCVEAALAWGWIDGQRRSLDASSFLQRLTPRRPRSNWSRRNVDIAERLISEARMQPSGLMHVESARTDGRWTRAYSGSANMMMPDDFMAELRRNPVAKNRFENLDRAAQFAAYHRLQTIKRDKNRKQVIAALIDELR